MHGSTVSDVLALFLPPDKIRQYERHLQPHQRQRKRDVVTLVRSMVMTSGSDDSGRQADILSTYLSCAPHKVGRSRFYTWFTMPLAFVIFWLLQDALAMVRAVSPILEGALSGMKDWRVVDSETVTLQKNLLPFFSATTKRAGVKIHKTFSFGRNTLVDVHLSPARQHDSPHLRIDESWRGYGLLIDLGYASSSGGHPCRRWVSLVYYTA